MAVVGAAAAVAATTTTTTSSKQQMEELEYMEKIIRERRPFPSQHRATTALGAAAAVAATTTTSKQRMEELEEREEFYYKQMMFNDNLIERLITTANFKAEEDVLKNVARRIAITHRFGVSRMPSQF